MIAIREQIVELQRLLGLAKQGISAFDLFAEGWPGDVLRLMRTGLIDDLLAARDDLHELRRSLGIPGALERSSGVVRDMRWTEHQAWHTEGFMITKVKKTQFSVKMHLRGSEWLFMGNFPSLKEAKGACRREAKHVDGIRAGDPRHKLGRMVSNIALARLQASVELERDEASND